MKRVLIAITTVTLLSCNSNGQKEINAKEEKQNKSFERTEAWVTRLVLDYFDSRGQGGGVRGKRMGDTEGMVYILNSLNESLDSARQKRIGSYILFPLFYRPVWKNDKLITTDWDSRVSRIKYISDSLFKIWSLALKATLGSESLEIEIIGYLIDMKSLFTNNGLNIQRSEQLLSRLKLLPKPAIESLGNAIDIEWAWAAMLLIQNDELFESSGNISQAHLDIAMKRLAEKLLKRN